MEQWEPVPGPVLIEMGRGLIAVFRDGSCEAFGESKAYPNDYALCHLTDVPQQPQVPVEVRDTLLKGLKLIEDELYSSHTYALKHPEEARALGDAVAWLDALPAGEGE